MTPLEKELVAALADLHRYARTTKGYGGTPLATDVETLLVRAKQTGTHEFTVADDGHGRAMVRASKLRDGGLRLAFGGMGVCVGDYFVGAGERRSQVNVGTRVRVELRDGCDFATLIEVLS